MSGARRRSHAPVFWVLFGAGGMLAALIGPMLVLITGVAVPLGLGLPADAMRYSNMLALAHDWLGKGLLFAIVSLFLWHAAHRILHSLHDLGVGSGPLARAACYGSALAGTLVMAWVLIALGV